VDVFAVRDRLVSDYHRYIDGFLRVRDDWIRCLVDRELDAGLLWPELWLSLNHAFAGGGDIRKLAVEECSILRSPRSSRWVADACSCVSTSEARWRPRPVLATC